MGGGPWGSPPHHPSTGSAAKEKPGSGPLKRRIQSCYQEHSLVIPLEGQRQTQSGGCHWWTRRIAQKWLEGEEDPQRLKINLKDKGGGESLEGQSRSTDLRGDIPGLCPLPLPPSAHSTPWDLTGLQKVSTNDIKPVEP